MKLKGVAGGLAGRTKQKWGKSRGGRAFTLEELVKHVTRGLPKGTGVRRKKSKRADGIAAHFAVWRGGKKKKLRTMNYSGNANRAGKDVERQIFGEGGKKEKITGRRRLGIHETLFVKQLWRPSIGDLWRCWCGATQ